MRFPFTVRSAVALMAFTLTIMGSSFAAEPAKPEEAAKNFYDLLRLHKVDGLPKNDAWKALKPLVTAELAAAIETAQKLQAEAIKKHPEDKPPFIEGDLFSSLFEGAQTHKTEPAKVEGEIAEVNLVLSYKEKEGSETSAWKDTLVLQKVKDSWLVADLKYDGNPKGTLLEILKPEEN